MHHIYSKLESILADETVIYNEIYTLEKEKTEAAIEKKGALIQELSANQEKLLFKIESLETERVKVLELISAETDIENGSTLSEITSKIDRDTSSRIMKCGTELKNVIIKLRDKQESNKMLLQDNIEFFEILISDLKNSSSLKSGYGSDGKEKSRVVNPVLFNTKA
ncbi:MAG TPA: flagellar protein FlgN [Spirochaetota bacterium]|nr:flagellar protein FlgN [Spirochaetota bacterium]HPF05262.1 flagellar protein FlgN [Spirochaetota bacterium]HPJ40878.1 flagellar protein FlgN [Spirochaetota bacterium]HPR37784.1 flagellar protein FlgN [Spirochaetota bacterium]HRX46538.1 flagellar protein FlgN [Spirochaetota bacterium]